MYIKPSNSLLCYESRSYSNLSRYYEREPQASVIPDKSVESVKKWRDRKKTKTKYAKSVLLWSNLAVFIVPSSLYIKYSYS